jgi:predicted small secreted protein
MKKLLLVLLAIVLSACTTVANAGEPKSDVQLAMEKWEAASISHYRFELFISCFCIFNENMPLVVEVKDGEVVSMEFKNGKEIDPQFLELFGRYNTIEKLFAGIEKGFDFEGDDQGPADKVTVEYDATNGFPTKIDIDFIEQAIDDELYLSVSSFEALP